MPKKVAHNGRAISYQRVSTQGQAKEDKNSFGRQQEAFDAWCAANPDHPPLETYRVARSGAEEGRFEWLFDGIKRGDYLPGDVLVVESINRFSREEMSEAITALFEIWKAGIRTAFCEFQGGIVLDNPYFNEHSYLIHGLAGQIDAARRLYEDRKYWSQDNVTKNHLAIYEGRLNDSHFKPRQPGKRVLYPFWLDFHPEDNQGRGGFRLNDGKKFVQRMFQLSLKDGQSVVAQKLNEEGFRNSDGRPYDGTTIGNYLKDTKVIGWWCPTRQIKDPKTGGRKNVQVGEVKKDVFAPVVTETLFNAVQQKIAERRQNEGTPNTGGSRMLNLFAGHMFCFKCGGLVRRYGQSHGFRPKLRCSVSKRDINECDQRTGVDYDEGQLLGMIQGFRWEEFFRDERKGEEIAQITEQQTQAQERLNEASQKVENLLKTQDDYADKGMAWPLRQQQRLEQFQADATQAQEALDRLSAQLGDISRQKTGKEAAEAVQQRLRDFIRNSDDLSARKDFNAWFASTGLVFLVSPGMQKLEPKWAIELGTGSIETKGRQRRLVGFEAASELILAGMQGDVHDLEREEYKQRLEQFRKTGVMEELEESDDLTPEEFYAALKKHLPADLFPPED